MMSVGGESEEEVMICDECRWRVMMVMSVGGESDEGDECRWR